jgi:RNA polymerase sigma-70 factor (ECF subfamily)
LKIRRFPEYRAGAGVCFDVGAQTWLLCSSRCADPLCKRRTTIMAVAGFRKDVEVTIPALRRYARALTRNRDIADDLVQDTLVRALRSEHLFHGGDVRSWLYTILTNLNRNRLRSLARRPPLSPIEDHDAPELAGPEAGGRDIERALARLVDDQRTALLLVVLEGLSYREVADVQGVPIGTVMSRLARARVQIKSFLDGERPALRRVK